MPFFRVETDMGFAGTDSVEIIWAEDEDEALAAAMEELLGHLSAEVIGGPYDSEEEAEEED